MPATLVVRPPAVAGKFYPAHPQQLQQMIATLLAEAEPVVVPGRIRGIIAPHAGYMYSGLTAAHAYKLLRGERYETVVVVSPSHWEYFRGVSVYPGDAYETPLGKIPVDTELRDALSTASESVLVAEVGHRAEHALEVQLPFLQETLPAGSFRVLPLVVGDQKRDICFALGNALAGALQDRNALLVASTDLSHYYPASVADRLDAVMIHDVAAFDFEQLMIDLETRRTEACGGGPTVAVMIALHELGIQKMKVTHRSTSGDMTGDYSSVVGYLSAVAYA
ncbi:MAG: AmmeMemoRadiSam system protein B [Ignavibacteria bacterium]